MAFRQPYTNSASDTEYCIKFESWLFYKIIHLEGDIIHRNSKMQSQLLHVICQTMRHEEKIGFPPRGEATSGEFQSHSNGAKPIQCCRNQHEQMNINKNGKQTKHKPTPAALFVRKRSPTALVCPFNPFAPFFFFFFFCEWLSPRSRKNSVQTIVQFRGTNQKIFQWAYGSPAYNALVHCPRRCAHSIAIEKNASFPSVVILNTWKNLFFPFLIFFHYCQSLSNQFFAFLLQFSNICFPLCLFVNSSGLI